MAMQYSCDFCGEPIQDGRFRVELEVSGHARRGYVHRDLGHYHASDERPCWEEMVDRIQLIHAVSSELGPDRQAIERRIELRAADDRGREERDASWQRYRELREAWRAMGRDARESLLLDVLGDDRLTGTELAEKMSVMFGASDERRPVLQSSDIRRMADAMTGTTLERIAEPFKGTLRYRYSRMVEVTQAGDA